MTGHLADQRRPKELAPRPRWLSGLEDVAVIVVTFNSAGCIAPCLRSIYAHLGSLRADVVVVDPGSRDGTVDIVTDFDNVRLIRCTNGGFAYANNRGLMTCDARYVLFMNPDTEILDGTLSDLVARMDERADGWTRRVTPSGR